MDTIRTYIGRGMMLRHRQLVLVRHGHAEPERKDLADIDRALDERGRAEAATSAENLLHADYVPDLVLASNARRTRETAALLARAFALTDEQMRVEPALYLASSSTLLQVLQQCPEEARTVLVVGHNPGLSELARRFDAQRTQIELKTGGICCLDLGDAPWSELMPHAAPWVLLP
jgi:phosphohistidine phosphatase